jgi:hypothetical protein
MEFDMTRQSQPTDFTVNVEDVGIFTFGKRTMRDEIAIQVAFARYIDGVEPTAWLQAVCGWLSSLSVLTVRAPDGWSLDDLDPLDEDCYRRLKRVHDALADKELSFRRGTGASGEGRGASAA